MAPRCLDNFLAGSGGGPLCDDFVQKGLIALACEGVPGARIIDKIRVANGLAEVFPVGWWQHGQSHHAVFGRVNVKRHQERMMFAARPQHVLPEAVVCDHRF